MFLCMHLLSSSGRNAFDFYEIEFRGTGHLLGGKQESVSFDGKTNIFQSLNRLSFFSDTDHKRVKGFLKGRSLTFGQTE